MEKLVQKLDDHERRLGALEGEYIEDDALIEQYTQHPAPFALTVETTTTPDTAFRAIADVSLAGYCEAVEQLAAVDTQADWQAGILPPQVEATVEGSVRLYRPIVSFSRPSAAYLPDGTQVAAAVARYWWGRWQNRFPLKTEWAFPGDNESNRAVAYSVTAGIEQTNWTLSARIAIWPDDTATSPRMTVRLKYSDGTLSTAQATQYTERDGIERHYTATVVKDPAKTIVEVTGWVLDYSTCPPGRHATATLIQLEPGAKTDWRPGGTGKAVLVEEGTRNALKFDSEDLAVGVAALGWGSDTPGVTRTVSADYALFGSKCVKWSKVDKSGVGNVYYNNAVNIDQTVVGDTWTFSTWVRRSDGQAVTAAMLGVTYIYINGENSKSVATIVDPVPVNGWYRAYATRTGTLGPGPITLVGFSGLVGTVDWYFDGWQAEPKAYATSFAGNGITRSSETLTIPTTGISSLQGTVAAWVYPKLATSANKRQAIFVAYPGTANALWIERGATTGKLKAIFSGLTTDSNAVISPDMWCRVVVTWTETSVSIYVNGVLDRSVAVANKIMLNAVATIGGHTTPGYEFDGYLDDVIVSTTAWSDADVAADYARTAPAVPGPNTLALLHMDGTLDSDYPSQATVITREMDLGDGQLPDRPVLIFPIGPDQPAGTAVTVTKYRMRALQTDPWGPWENATAEGLTQDPPLRYLEVELQLSTTAPDVTPQVDRLGIYD